MSIPFIFNLYIGADGRHFQFQYDARGTLQNVIKAQNASLIYQRNQPENFFSIQKVNRNSLLQIQNINYITSFAGSKVDSSSINSTDGSCLFGGDGYSFGDPGTDLVYSIDLQSLDPFSSCNDPFAGMWGFEGAGFGEEQGSCYTDCYRLQTSDCYEQGRRAFNRARIADSGVGAATGAGIGTGIGTFIEPGGGSVVGGVIGGVVGGVVGFANAVQVGVDTEEECKQKARVYCTEKCK